MVNSVVTQDTTVLILYDDTILNNEHYKFASEIVNHLLPQKIKATVKRYKDVEAQASGFYQWLIIIYSPNIPPSLENLVSTVMQHVVMRQRQGVLLVTTEQGQPIQPLAWSVIRQYDGNDPYIYDKISRALQYTKIPYLEAKQAQNVFARLSSKAPVKGNGWLAPALLVFVIIALLFGSFKVLVPMLLSTTSSGSFTISTPNTTFQTTLTPTNVLTTTPQVTPNPTVSIEKQKQYNSVTANDKQLIISKFDPTLWNSPSTAATVCQVQSDGTYLSSEQRMGTYNPCTAKTIKLTNFVYQVGMIIKDGDAGGVIFRYDSQGNYYRFSISKGTTPKQLNYNVYLCGGDAICSPDGVGQGIQKIPLPGNTPSTISIDDPNLPIELTVIAQKNSIDFYINKHYAASISGDPIISGTIGVYAALFTSANTHYTQTDVIFSNLKVWDLDK